MNPGDRREHIVIWGVRGGEALLPLRAARVVTKGYSVALDYTAGVLAPAHRERVLRAGEENGSIDLSVGRLGCRKVGVVKVVLEICRPRECQGGESGPRTVEDRGVFPRRSGKEKERARAAPLKKSASACFSFVPSKTWNGSRANSASQWREDVALKTNAKEEPRRRSGAKPTRGGLLFPPRGLTSMKSASRSSSPKSRLMPLLCRCDEDEGPPGPRRRSLSLLSMANGDDTRSGEARFFDTRSQRKRPLRCI